VGAFGNFLNRALTFSVKNFDGVVPDGVIDAEVMAGSVKPWRSYIRPGGVRVQEATDSVMTLADYGNIYFQNHEPWKLIKNDKASAGSVLRSCLQIAKALVIFMEPVMPAKWKLPGSSSAWRVVPAKCPSRKPLAPLAAGQKLGSQRFSLSHGRAIRQELDRIFKERIEQSESKEKGKTAKKKGEISLRISSLWIYASER